MTGSVRQWFGQSHINGDAPDLRFVPREQLGGRSTARLILEIHIGELLPVVVAHDKAGWLFLDRPGRREEAMTETLNHRESQVYAYNFSYAMREAQIVWTTENLNSHTKNPQG
jgi:hypothetical protein